MSLHRGRIEQLIGAALGQGPLTFLIAPPGYGKTIALRDSLPPDVTWVRTPPRARLEDVTRTLLAATVPEHLRSLPALFDGSGLPKDPAAVFEWMAKQLRVFDGTIVVDDLHRCFADPLGITFLTQIMEATSSYINWVCASREVPAFPIGTWIARGLMALPITADELRFDRSEVEQLAQSLNVDVDPETLRLITDDTGGWPMAVHLELQLWERTRSFAPLQIRTRDVLFSQIENELWPILDPELREVIVACALLSEANADILATAGFTSPDVILERAERLIPFLRRMPGGDYVLHDLFAEFVLKMTKRTPAIVDELRDRLSTGLLMQSRYVEAIKMLIAADAPERVVEVLIDHGFRLLEQGQRGVVSAALGYLGRRGFQTHAVVTALRGLQSWTDGSWKNAEALFTHAFERGLPPQMRQETGLRLATVLYNQGQGERAAALLGSLIEDPRTNDRDRVELRSALALAYATAGNRDAARAAQRIVAQSLGITDLEMRARVLQRMGACAHYVGDLDEAVAFSRDSAQLAVDLNLWVTAANAYSVLYSTAAIREGDSRVALGYARMITSAAERAAHAGQTAYGLRAEYVLYADRGDLAAFDEIEGRMARFQDVATFRSLFAARYARALADAIRGATRKAVTVITTTDAREFTEAERALRDSLLAFLYFLDDRRDESLDLLKSPLLVNVSDDFASRRYVNLARAVRGVALWCNDRTAQARRSFAFDEGALAERDRILFSAIVAICSHPGNMVSRESVATELERLRSFGWGGYAALIERAYDAMTSTVILTTAELKTLRAFRHGATTEDVANALGKSPHTIEAQLKSTYRKIGCASRAEALAYARARGWLDDALRAGIPESR